MKIVFRIAAVAALALALAGCGTINAASGPHGTVVAGTGLNAGMASELIDSGAYAQRVDANNRAALTGARIAHGNVQNASVVALTRMVNICVDKVAAGAVKADPVLTCICSNAMRGADARERLRITGERGDQPLEPGDYGEAEETAEAVAAASGSYRGGYLVYDQCGSITGQQRRIAALEAEVAKSRRNERVLRDGLSELAAAAQKKGGK